MKSEFRQDLISGQWVLISPGRQARPGTHTTKEKFYQSKEDCPFEQMFTRPTGGLDDKFATNIKNQFPALNEGSCGDSRQTGPFTVYDANGFHELVITRDHDRSFAQFTKEETQEVLELYLNRYKEIASQECGDYILIFHNHGKSAGASVYHNHSQIIATPILPTEVMESIRGAEKFYKEHGEKAHDLVMSWEIAEGKRIVYENEKFIAFCPFVSKTPYEMRIFPKVSTPHFQETKAEDLPYMADILNVVLGKLYHALDDVDYNFYIHTAPAKNDPTGSHEFYGWHFEIVPRISIAAGFELGTAIYINPVDPDDAAELLKNTKHE